METNRTCPQCSQPLAADAPDGLCPQCLMKAASGPPPSTSGVGLADDIIDIGDPAEVAKNLPQFEILEMLGRGGMGVVYKARQLQLDRLVALKILPPLDALSADFVARFTREARALAKLNHPNIVNVHDFGETGGLYYIVMEYVEGANLRQLLETRKLTPAEALAIVPKICDALEYAHEEGLVHRDIKPENLLVDKKGRVKIADFGLAKLLRREPLDMTLTLSSMALGTLRYMAPEQMDKPETVDHRADLYSLGVVIYEMLTGETPVGRFELPSQKAQVDVRLDEIVLHALEREPARRYQHASEIRTDMENVSSQPPVAPIQPRIDGSEAASPDTAENTARVRRARASWLGRRSDRFRTLVSVALNLLLPVFLLLGLVDQVDTGAMVLKQPFLLRLGWFSAALLIIFPIQWCADIDSLVRHGFLRRDLVPPASPHAILPLPRFYWLRVFGLLIPAWLVVGVLWNFRTPGCLLGSLLLGWIVIEAILRYLLRKPRWARDWCSARAGERVFFLSMISVVVMLLFMLTITAMNVEWETSVFRWNRLAPSREAFEAAHQGKEYQLIRGLDAFKDQIPTTELRQNHGDYHAGWRLWGESGPYHGLFGWMSLGASVVVVTLSLLLLSQQVLGAGRFCALYIATGEWRPALALTGAVLASVVCVYGVLACSSLSSPDMEHSKTATVQASVKQVRMALQTWAAENAYAPGDDSRWSFDTVPSGQGVAEVALFDAWKPSQFDRWKMTWSGLRRITPHVAAQVVGTGKPLQSFVIYSAAMSQADERDKEQSERVMQSMADAIAKAPAIDVNKPVDESRKSGDGAASAAKEISPWALFLGVLGLTVSWATFRSRVSVDRHCLTPSATNATGGPEVAPASAAPEIKSGPENTGGAQAAASPLPGGPRLSLLALWGAICAGAGLLAGAVIFAAVSDSPPGKPDAILHLSTGFWVFFSISGLFGSTFLGSNAIGAIKRSGGKIHGLPLAAFAAWLVPLLVLGSAAVAVTHLLQIAVWTKVHMGYVYDAGRLVNTIAPPPNTYPGMSFMILDGIVAIGVCFFAARAAWRAIEPAH